MSCLSLMKTEFQFHKIRRVLEMVVDYGRTAVWLYVLCLHYTTERDT